MKLIQGYDKYVAKIENLFKNVVLKILLSQSQAIKASFLKIINEKKVKDDGMSSDEADKQSKSLVDKIFKVIESTVAFKAIMSQLLPLWLNAAETGNEFFNIIQFTKPEDGTLFSVIRDDYTTWLDTYGTDMITSVTQTTKDITREIIKDGLINGDSINTIADNLVSKIDEYSKRRAVTIAETETHNSFMKGNFMSANASGFKNKTWITAGDGQVRDTHKALNNKTVKIDKDFKPSLGYPGDSRAPAKETIKCRCILMYS